jgi:hypothetical protein
MQNTSLRPFDEMVSILFKSSGYHDPAMGLVHATIGVMGEVIELGNYTNEGNFIEEAGDLEFYLEAAAQQIIQIAQPTHQDLQMVLQDGINLFVDTPVPPAEIKGHAWSMAICASDLLDLSKKIWVYKKNPDEMVIDMLGLVAFLRARLLHLYRMKGIDRTLVIVSNQEKLGKRYPDGVYSDSHAQSRLDKEGEVA